MKNRVLCILSAVFFCLLTAGVGAQQAFAFPEIGTIQAEIRDTIRPSVSLVAPARGSVVSGVVTVRAEAQDNVRVARVVFLLNGQRLAVDETAPYTFEWNTRAVRDGEYRLAAAAWDAAGNAADTGYTVVVRNGATQQRGMIAGRVRAANGESLAGATVTITAGPDAVGRTATSGDGGAFSFSALPVGTYRLTAAKTGFTSAVREGILVVAERTTSVEFVLQRLSSEQVGYGVLVGHVRDTGLHALAGAVVQIVAGPAGIGRQAVTDSNGAFRIAELRAGTGYAVRATREGYLPRAAEGIRILSGGTVEVNLILTAAQTLRYGAITGKVTDGDGRPLAGVVVRVLRGPAGVGRTATTDASGAYRLNELTAGENYALTATRDGYTAQTREGIRVTAGQSTAVSFVLRRNTATTGYGVIEGMVTNGEGQALAGATVEIVAGPAGIGRRTLTGERGGFRFGELTAGTYALRASRDGYGTRTLEGIRVVAGSGTAVRFVLTR